MRKFTLRLLGLPLIAVPCVAAASEYDVSERYTYLRNLILNLKPSEIQLPSSEPKPVVWGVVIDHGVSTPFVDYVLTVVTLADINSHTSIYTSRGAAFLGLGADPTIARLSRSLLAKAHRVYPEMNPVTSFPLPALGHLRIYVLTFSGAYGADVRKADVEKQTHPWYPIYCDFQEILDKNPDKWKSLR